MDVHKPKAPHSAREFILEIFVIVLGVLIALGAEQIVQTIEWRHKIEAAEEAMTTELRDDDGPEIYARYAINSCLTKRLDDIRSAADNGADRATIARLVQSYRLPFWTWDSLALEAANASNVFTRMNADRAKRWSQAYAVMPALDRANEREFRDLAELRALSTSGGPLSADERAQLLRAVELLRQDTLQIFSAVQAALPSIYAAGVRFDQVRVAQVVGGLGGRLGFTDCITQPPQPPAPAAD